MSRHCAVQIIEHVSEGRFKPKNGVIEEIFGNKRVKNLPIVVICIAGAARKGKSFLLNFFLSYFIHMEMDSGVPWILDENTKLEGFEFQEGMKRTTVGIWAWNHVFVIKQRDGTEIGVSLIDSQGTFDNNTTFEDSAIIFGMTCLFGSVMCFNVFNELQEDKLDIFAVFIEYAKKINDNLGGSGKLFQDLVFLVRDCQFYEYIEDRNGGNKYLDAVFAPNEVPQLQQVRNTLNNSYERKHGFVFPHPGDKVARTKTSKISEINQLFVEIVERMILSLFSDLTLHKKKLGSTFIHCGEMQQYIENCVQTFDDNKTFAPQAIQAVNREFMLSVEVKRAAQKYEELMNGEFSDNKTGFNEEKMNLMDVLIYSQIEADIFKRILDKDICNNVLKKFEDAHKTLYKQYTEKNDLLVEKEVERLQHEEECQLQQDIYHASLCDEKERMEKLKKDSEEREKKLIEKQNCEKMHFERKLKEEKEDYEKEKHKEAEKHAKEKKELEDKIKKNNSEESRNQIMEFVTSMTPIAGAAAHFAGETFSSFLARRSYESEMSHERGEYSNVGSRMYGSSSDRGGYGYSGAARGMSHARGGGNSYPAAPGYSDSEFSGGRGGSSRESYRRGR